MNIEEILAGLFKPWGKVTYGHGHWTLQQDGATSQAARITQ